MADAMPRDEMDGRYTVEEFYDLIPDGQKADLIEGVIYVSSPDTKKSDSLNSFLLTLMQVVAGARGLGHVSGSRYAYRLGKRRAPEPDVAFVQADRVRQVVGENEGLGPPDVAVEVVSRDSRTRDYRDKKNLYEKTGVREYWLLDPLKRRTMFYRLHSGSYQLVDLEDGRIFRSQACPGFWLDVEWLFPPPADVLAVAQQILATMKPM